MKKLLSLILSLCMLLTCATAFAKTTSMIELIAVECGAIESVDNGLRLAGRTPDFTADAYLNTLHILGESISDFVWTFDYTPEQVDWNTDKFMFRANQENEWEGYGLMIQGNQLGASLSICKGEAWGDPYITVPFTLEWNQTYSVRIEMEGAQVQVWFDEAGSEPAAEPLMSVTVPDGPDYRDMYLDEGDFQIISWAGNFVISNMNVQIGHEPPQPVEPEEVWFPSNTIGLSGLSMQEADPNLPATWQNVVPVDLTVQGRHTWPLVIGDMFHIGLCHADVEGDNVTITCELKKNPSIFVEAEYGRFFTALDQITADSLTGTDAALPFGTPVSIRNDLNGAEVALLYIRSTATFCLPLDYGETLPRYWRNMPDRVAYRAVLSDLMARVPAVSVEGEAEAAPVAAASNDLVDMISLESGLLRKVENGVRLAGRTADDSADAYLNSRHLLGREVSDFVWTFDYTPSQVDWNHDKFAFRCVNENEWDMYALYIKGGNLGACLDLSKGEAYDKPFATAEFWMDWEVTYTIRIQMIGQDVKVWAAEKDEFDPDAEPVLACTVPNVEGTDHYTDKYVPAGDFQIFSWAGQFVVSNMTIEELN